uniref:AT-hook motif nuclear-localized protein n=1 Tax=Kalanchoe fedtschenkoi TaxID=63787 RepID=A0A7N0SW86_KALFE
MEVKAYPPGPAEPELAVSGGGGSGEVNGGNHHVSGESAPTKRKRGRPKKTPGQAHEQPDMVTLMGFPSPTQSDPPVKRGRGRPKGSTSKPRFVPVTPPPGFGGEVFVYGVDLTPHVLTIYPGEDVHGRILSFAQNGSRAINVLACHGPVSCISICSPGSNGGMIYEGLFEILTLNGNFSCTENEGSYRRIGMLTATLAKPNGDVFGGCVSGPIVAAGLIQVRRPQETQFRNYSVTHFPEATPPPSAQGHVTVAKSGDHDHCQEAGQDYVVPPQPVSMNNGPIAPIVGHPNGHQAPVPVTGVTASPQPNESPLDNTSTSVSDHQ